MQAFQFFGGVPRRITYDNTKVTGALLDRLTRRVHILEANGQSYRLQDAKGRLKRR